MLHLTYTNNEHSFFLSSAERLPALIETLLYAVASRQISLNISTVGNHFMFGSWDDICGH